MRKKELNVDGEGEGRRRNEWIGEEELKKKK